ncbi:MULTISPECIES: ammonia-dependent NAD(+) synthetase [Rothia]|uniref:NH(3)-dependent NAD(+) synthetase n=1 Tax=Rothia kristinae TaxID=37923 RepID=A0A147EC44_9MICC|nr:ammonia-dependent NAD(+) synthetase [Rothia kristinae]MBE8527641.1 ammonia-dependent NAD(+) synthetase [Amycolatopsis sp. H6(2020)]TDP54438.1 NH(3)-dependent NAD(+) synthetase [Kocuria sp. AG109]SIL73939.1 NH(3)-dependent NAD(+) synthetase [Mycobacteroides abscessus subsp. abscessus]KTR39379.1 NAD synthetase [Rothia kristinae]KTR56078.1 NAD synthetase [Rothia kristinae]
MRELQQQIIDEMGVRPQIDPAEEIDRRVGFLCEYLRLTGAKGFVLGISGGIDSSLAGRLAQLAVERLAAEGTEAEFVAVRLPYRTQADEADAQRALEFIRPQTSLVFDVEPATTGIERVYRAATGADLTDFTKGNVKARQRMIAQYAIAGDRSLLVIGTDHAAESVTGFFTKYGDGGADILPLFGLDKRQNQALLRELGAPEAVWTKKPTADLLDATPGREDEDELGITYDVIDDYLEGREVTAEQAEAIERRYLITRHKRTTPVSLVDPWWKNDR